MKQFSLSVTCLLLFMYAFPQIPGIQWEQLLGRQYRDGFRKIIKTNDGGLLAAGFVTKDSSSNTDIIIIKKTLGGITEWDKTIGGQKSEFVNSVIQDKDGNYLLVGYSTSTEMSGHHGVNVTDTGNANASRDAIVIKLSSAGNILWQKFIGGKNDDEAYAICIDSSNNLIITGRTRSADGDFMNMRRDISGSSEDAFIIKLSPDGNLTNAKCFGGTKNDGLTNVVLLNNSIISTGYTYSNDLDVNGFHLNPADTLQSYSQDVWFVRLNSDWILQSQKCIGGTNYDKAAVMKKTGDKSLLFCGYTGSIDGDITTHSPILTDKENTEWAYDGWLVELDSNGTILNKKTYGGSERDVFNDFYITPDGSMLVAGAIGSSYGYTGFSIDAYAYIFRYDANSNFPQLSLLGYDTNYNEVFSIVCHSNNAYTLVGERKPEGDFRNVQAWIFGYGSNNIVTGKAFVDANSNNLYDVGERVYTQLKIQAEKGGLTNGGLTNENGSYYFSVDTGTYTVKPAVTNLYYTVTPVTKTISHSTYFNIDTIDFALQPIANKKDLVVSLLPLTAARPGFDVSYKLTYFNRGTTTIASGKVKLKKDNKLNFISASPTNSTASGDTLIWNFTNLKPFDTTSITLNLKLATPPTANIGDTLRSIALLDPVSGDETPNDDTTTLVQVVQSSYDPNDKTELHGGRITSAQIAGTEYLTYLIRFQNTGTDTAFNIFVRDTLDSKLDWNSLEMLGSSHNYNLTIKDGNKLEWFFTNIKLVDSTTNEPTSHGYIAYRIKPKPTLAEGDSVQNRASIYFDYNLPVNTNNNKTYLRSNIVTAVIDLSSPETQLYLYPNPASGMVVLTKGGKIKGHAILQIRDISGKLVRQINFGMINASDFKKQVDVNGLPKGVYLLQLSVDRKLFTGKLLIL